MQPTLRQIRYIFSAQTDNKDIFPDIHKKLKMEMAVDQSALDDLQLDNELKSDPDTICISVDIFYPNTLPSTSILPDNAKSNAQTALIMARLGVQTLHLDKIRHPDTTIEGVEFQDSRIETRMINSGGLERFVYKRT